MKKTVVDEIVSLEWEMFQNTVNEGGRASCQDDYSTFDIMRRSQWEALPENVSASYLRDLHTAVSEGRNLVMEKYARIMAYTFPDEYARIRDLLPPLSDEVESLAEQISARQTDLDAEAWERYPHVRGLGRSARQGDIRGDTAFDVYLKGELLTYSVQTLKLYLDHMVHYSGNIVIDILENISRLRGYESLADAERAMSR